ncbi:MAG: pyrroloquinoline quinone-dependent dehydrogenase [Janthinobacterium lividum]
MDRRRRLLGGVASLALAVCLISPAWSQSAPLANENPQAPSQGGTAAPQVPGAPQAAAGGSQAATGAGPGGADYAKADADAENWILPAKSYSGNRYVDLPAVTPQSVGKLKPAWTFKISDPGPMEVAPLVWHGTMFVTSAHDHVYAIDAATGAQKWEFVDSPHVIAFAGNRGVALMGDKVFLGTLDGHVIALDAATGAKAWDVVGVDEPKNSFYTMAPVPYHNSATNQDMLLLGVSNGDWGGRGYVQAFDPKDGHVLWRWYTVPGPGEPGNDTWPGDTWKRGGASVWAGVAIDPASQTLYLDLGNPQPDFLGTVRPGANLFSNSMVALDISGPSTPKMKWYHQFIAHDTHDWDPSMPPVLFHGKAGGQEEDLVAAGDKAGNFWVLDSGDGHLVSQTAASFQHNQNTEPTAAGNVACPNTNGGIEYNGGTYDPGTNAFFVPSVNECGFWKSTQQAVYISGQFYLGGIFPTFVGPNTGDMNAISIDSGVFSWRKHMDLPAVGGALVTKSGVVFTSELNGKFDAFDTKTGDQLWSAQTPNAIIAPPSAYQAGGKTFVVVASGGAGNQKVPELKSTAVDASISAYVMP